MIVFFAAKLHSALEYLDGVLGDYDKPTAVNALLRYGFDPEQALNDLLNKGFSSYSFFLSLSQTMLCFGRCPSLSIACHPLLPPLTLTLILAMFLTTRLCFGPQVPNRVLITSENNFLSCII